MFLFKFDNRSINFNIKANNCFFGRNCNMLCLFICNTMKTWVLRPLSRLLIISKYL